MIAFLTDSGWCGWEQERAGVGVAGRSDEPLLPVPVLGEIEVCLPDQRPHELRLARRRQAESGGLARLVLEQPSKHFLVLRGQPDGDDLVEHVIGCNQCEYTSIRDTGRDTCASQAVIFQDLHEARSRRSECLL